MNFYHHNKNGVDFKTHKSVFVEFSMEYFHIKDVIDENCHS